jgi:protoporphyrinogen IX oxidase
MLWLLLLHVSAVVCWSGSLLYLPALIAGTASHQETIDQQRHLDLTLMVYRLISTPSALIAIISGTGLFLTGGITDHWLILKLTLVVALVACHALSGWNILRTQQAPNSSVTLSCVLLGVMSATLIPVIVWVVLTKPF